LSREQANTYKKFRTAEDPKGNLGWAAGMHKKGVKVAVEARDSVPADFGFKTREKALWELMRIARVYSDIENAGLMEPDAVRGYVRGLIAADVLDVLDADACKAVVPLEIKRAVAKAKGKDAKKKAPAKASKLKARVYRPDISKPGEGDEDKAESAPESAPPSSSPAPAPVPEAAAPSSSGGLSADEKELKERFSSAYKAMKEQTHYAFLGVPSGADTKAIKSAYVKKARELHPDNIAGTKLQENEKLVEMADRLFKRLQEAHRILTSDSDRAQYDADLQKSGGAPVEKTGKVKRPREAQLAFKKAEVFFKKKEFKQAEQHYKLAMEFDPDEMAYVLAAAWCLYFDERKDEGKRQAEATEKLERLVERKVDDAAYKLGLIARQAGDEGKAVAWFKRTLTMNPRHKDAQQEKRLWEMRIRKEREEKEKNDRGKSGVLGKFFKR